VEVMIEAYGLIAQKAEADAVNYGRFSPYNLAPLWLSRVRVPGVDLNPQGTYQVDEIELLSREDYPRILEMGWPDFLDEYLRLRVFTGVPPEVLPWNQASIDVTARWAEIGVPVLKGGTVAPPFEFLCGGRGLRAFSADLFQIPEIVEKVMEEIQRHQVGPACQLNQAGGYHAIWVGGWRGAPCMLSPAMWDRFVWPYMKSLAREIIVEGYIPLFHLDSDWSRELARFRELPPAKSIVALDGCTDIFSAARTLRGHTCLMGDVPAAMLVMGTPEEVTRYCRGLLAELGPDGFILQSGCDIPENARVENVQAMVEAAVSL